MSKKFKKPRSKRNLAKVKKIKSDYGSDEGSNSISFSDIYPLYNTLLLLAIIYSSICSLLYGFLYINLYSLIEESLFDKK